MQLNLAISQCERGRLEQFAIHQTLLNMYLLYETATVLKSECLKSECELQVWISSQRTDIPK